jgi:hypothetical protein
MKRELKLAFRDDFNESGNRFFTKVNPLNLKGLLFYSQCLFIHLQNPLPGKFMVHNWFLKVA